MHGQSDHLATEKTQADLAAPPEQTGRTAAEMREALKQNCTFPQNVKITILGRNSIQWFEKEIALISTIWQAGRNSPSFLGERKDVQLWLLSHCHQDGKKKKKKTNSR